MIGKINQFFHEYICGLSIFLTILGAIVLILGALGTWWPTVLVDSNIMNQDIAVWSPYIFGLGIIVVLTGIYYLYSYLTHKRFFISELETNKRSEFIKRHQDIKNAVKFLPKKYQTILKEKEKEFKIR